MFSGIIETVKKEKPKCIFLTSPNNPDGSIINEEDLLAILHLDQKMKASAWLKNPWLLTRVFLQLTPCES
jgi:hypothetical protein